MSRGASSEADNVRDKTRYMEAPVLLSQESHPHLRGWNWRSSMRSWSWNYTAAFCLVGAVFCKISWSCRGFARSWCVSEFLNQHWCGQALTCPLRREERGSSGEWNILQERLLPFECCGLCIQIKSRRAPGSVVSSPISVTVCLFAEKWLTAHVRHKHPFITQLVSP